ncbi:hypothetical protein ABC610_02600 [Mycoplasmopsis synoviae]|uniref:hypothetical protein n=1 Tax=Mycoplasmopsis synoviae TaxID=2109 RepID=UPI00349E754A
MKNEINDETYIKKFKDIFNGHDFLNSFQNYKKKYNSEKIKRLPFDSKLIKDENQNIVKEVKWIYNSIDLNWYVERKWKSLNVCLAKKELEEFIISKFNKLKDKSCEINIDDPMFTWDFYRYIIIEDLMPNIKQAYKESIEKESKNLKSYELELRKLNQRFNFIDFNSKGYPKFENISKIENEFMYQIRNKNKSKIKILSKRELQFINDLKKFKDNLNKLDNPIQFSWSSNVVNGNISFEYFDNQETSFEDENIELNGIKRSFPDFLTIINEKHLIFLEVKAQGEDDYNSEKTKSLIKAYKKYVEVYKNQLKNNDLKNNKFASFTMAVVFLS